MEFTPFQKNCITETEARQAAESYPIDTTRFGHFVAPSLNQLLYFFSENLINGAILTEMEARTLYRLSETIKKPVFLAANTDEEESLAKKERLPIAGLYFPRFPAEETIKNRIKPYIAAFPSKPTEDLCALLQTAPPFAFHCKTEEEAEIAAYWQRKMTKEMR